MLTLNWLAVFSTAIIPLLVGAVYYHPKVLGTASALSRGASERDLNQGNSPKVYIYTLLLGFLLAIFVMPMVLHMTHVYSLVGGAVEPGSQEGLDAAAYLQKYGDNFRTFKHGVLHGTIAALFGAWPILATIALFEKRSWKYIAIHAGYWVVVLALMGGVICAFA